MLPLLNKINSNLRSKTIVSLVDSEPRLYEKYSLYGKNFLLKLIYIFISNQSKKLERILLNYNIPLHFVSNVDGDYFDGGDDDDDDDDDGIVGEHCDYVVDDAGCSQVVYIKIKGGEER